jgi:hypothetical protein
MKRIKKILKYVLIILAILVIIIIFPIFSYKKEVNDNPLPSYYKKGVYHIHSVFSDGKGTINDITNAAASLNFDFAILTDHGEPNIKSSTSTNYLNNVLLIGGAEFSLHSGHLAAMGFNIPDYIFPPEPQEAINEVIHDKGVCFISHPFDDRIPWTDWDIQGFTGLEVLSSYSSARRISFFKLIAFPLQYMLNSNYALVSTLKYPEENIRKWDSLNALNSNLEDKSRSGRYYGIYALDAHGKLPITEKFQLNFPSYKAMFEILTVYVKVDKELEKDPHQAAATIIASLRKGNFFNVIEAIAPANGFEAWFIDKSGQRFEMGSVSETSEGKLIILLPFQFETDIIIKKDGTEYEQITNNQEKKLEIELKGPGCYIIEVYISKNKFNKLPWIMANPFFIGVKESLSVPAKREKIILKQLLVNEKGFFKVEKNSRSEGFVLYEISDKDELITTFTFKLVKESPDEKDFWSALTARKGFDFSNFKGFVFEARSDRKRRFWAEFRTGSLGEETWYRYSFLVNKEWNRFHIPFKKFHVIFGENKPPMLSNIVSIFFSINNANAYPGTEGNIDFKNVGLY